MYELDSPSSSPSALRFRNFKGCFEPDFIGLQVILSPQERVGFFQVSDFRWGMALSQGVFPVRKQEVQLEENQEWLDHLADEDHMQLDCWSWCSSPSYDKIKLFIYLKYNFTNCQEKKVDSVAKTIKREMTLSQQPIAAIWLQLDIDNVEKFPLSPRSTCPNRRGISATKA
jgi:hypothetical protein